MSKGRVLAAGVAVALLAPSMTLPARAAAGNDFPGGALPISLGTPVLADSSAADPGLSPGEPEPSCSSATHTLWFAFDVTETSRLDVSSFGSKVDTVLAVYDTTLAEVACNDDDLETGSMLARARTLVQPGSYLVQLGTYAAPGAVGGKLRLVVDRSAALVGDSIDEAFLVTGDADFEVDLASYTVGAEDRSRYCWAWGTTAWFKVVAPQDGVVDISTLDSEADTILGVYDADIDEKACVDAYATLGEQAAFAVDAGDVLYVSVDLWWVDYTNVVPISFRFTEQLPGDEWQDALPLPRKTEVNGALSGFSLSGDDPRSCYGGDGRSVWYTATAGEAGTYSADIRTDEDIHVSLFTEDPTGSYASACDGSNSVLLAAGQQVWIMVSDHFGSAPVGNFVVEFQRAVGAAPVFVREDGHATVWAPYVFADADPEHERARVCTSVYIYQCHGLS